MSGSRTDLVFAVYSSARTVFNLADLAVLTGEGRFPAINQKANYYVRTGKLLNPRRGLYAKREYRPEELACKIYTPSYISLEYVLQRAGVIFQYGAGITLASYLSRTVTQGRDRYEYHRIKGEILVNPRGVTTKDGITIASPERAFLDTLYLKPGFYFDNPHALDRDAVRSLLPVYQSKALTARAERILA